MNLNKELSVGGLLYGTYCALEDKKEGNFPKEIKNIIEYFSSLIKDLEIFEPKKVAEVMSGLLNKDVAEDIYNSFFEKAEEIYSLEYSEKLSKPLREYLERTIEVDEKTELALKFLSSQKKIELSEISRNYSCLYLLVPKKNIKEKMLFNDYEIPYILKIKGEELTIEYGVENEFRIHLGKKYKATSYSFNEKGEMIQVFNSTNLNKKFYEVNELFTVKEN